MSLKFVGKKQGMTQIFDRNGNSVACTVIFVEPNIVAQVKTKKNDGYEAIQVAAIKRKKNVTKPLLGHYAKAKIDPCWKLSESRVEKSEEYQVGQKLELSYFTEGSFVDVCGVSKGKGFQGVIKLHGFAGGPGAHGSGFHRHAGSTGMRSSPGRCFPLGPRASRMGNDVITMQNLKVISVLPEKGLLVVEGAIPGGRGGVVYITKAKKKAKAKAK